MYGDFCNLYVTGDISHMALVALVALVAAEALSRPQRFLRKIRSKIRHSVSPCTEQISCGQHPNVPEQDVGHVRHVGHIPCLSSVTKEATLAVSDPRLQNAQLAVS